MGFIYLKLQENKLARAHLPARIWVMVKRAAVKVFLRRRWVMKHARKVTWSGLMRRVRRAVGLVSQSSAPAAASYDLDSYAQNFDDGGWKQEESDFWRCNSFAYRFGQSARLVI